MPTGDDAASSPSDKEQRMKRVFALVAVAAAFAAPAGTASGAASQAPSANVDSIATVTSANTVIFEFDLYNCPTGNPITVDWTANQPARPDSGAVGGGDFGLSNGTSVQHLTIEAAMSSFLAGERWVGTGTVNCGAVAIPVTGSGQTKSPNGV
jgi:hypothetical protein